MVKSLDPGRRDEVVDVLVELFWTYPTMAYMLGNEGDHDRSVLRTLIGMFVDGRFGRSSLVLGIEVEERIVAATLVDTPTLGPLREPYRTQISEARSQLGADVGARIEAFGDASSALEPDVSHHGGRKKPGRVSGVRVQHRRRCHCQ